MLRVGNDTGCTHRNRPSKHDACASDWNVSFRNNAVLTCRLGCTVVCSLRKMYCLTRSLLSAQQIFYLAVSGLQQQMHSSRLLCSITHHHEIYPLPPSAHRFPARINEIKDTKIPWQGSQPHVYHHIEDVRNRQIRVSQEGAMQAQNRARNNRKSLELLHFLPAKQAESLLPLIGGGGLRWEV